MRGGLRAQRAARRRAAGGISGPDAYQEFRISTRRVANIQILNVSFHNGTGVLKVKVLADPESVIQLMRGSLPTLSDVTPDPEKDTVLENVTGSGTPQVLSLEATVALVRVPLEVIVYRSRGWQRLLTGQLSSLH